MPDEPPAELNEEGVRVLMWRRTELLRVGYAIEDAEDLARDPDVDLHYALDLIKRGCPPEMAAKIVR